MLYSFAILVSGSGGTVTAQAYQYYTPRGYTAPQLIPLQTTPQQLQLLLNTNGNNTEFTVILARSIFYGINNTPAPSPSASVAPTASGTSPASPTQSGAPAQYWNFNFFIAQGTLSGLTPVDSLDYGGPSDTSYTSPALNTSIQFDVSITVQQGNHPTDQGADNIQSGEIANNP